MAMAFVNVPAPTGPSQLAPEDIKTPEQFRAECESALREVADTTGAVILGRAGMVALGKRPDVLCVRLDGPVEDRIAQVVAQGVDEASARKGQREVDKARDAYARVFFGARQDDPRLYHVILDSTALSVQTCVEIIARAARDRFDERAG
jgi:cytidylate kinase